MNPRPRSWLFVRREIASGLGARLIILEVVPLGVTIYGPASDEYLKQMEERLDQFQVNDPAVRVERRIVEGNPAAEILRAAEESDCDLIVMASHGRTGAKRIMLGECCRDRIARVSVSCLDCEDARKYDGVDRANRGQRMPAISWL